MYKTKPVGASSSFILHTATHIFMDHMLSYARRQLGVQPCVSSHTTLPPPFRWQAGSPWLPRLSWACSALPGLHTVPHAPILASRANPSERACLRSYCSLPQLLSLSFRSAVFDHPHLMSVPYFLKLGCTTTIIFPYNTCIMTPYEFLPEILEGKEHARCLFSGSDRANVPVLDREQRNNTFLLAHYAFSSHCFARRHKRHKAWKETMQRRKNKNPEGCSGGVGTEKRNRKIDKET